MSKPNTNRSNGKSRRPNSKGHRRGSRSQSKEYNFDEEAKLSGKGRDNDPNWYFTSNEIANQAAQLSFQEFVGSQTGVDGYSIPAIATIAVNPCPGVTYAPDSYESTHNISLSAKTSFPAATWDTGAGNKLPNNAYAYKLDGINLSALKTYTLMSSFTGRTQQYGPQDVAMMILAISEVAAVSEHIRRAFGVLLTYNERNRMLPLGLIKSMGMDPEDMMQNIADYRMQFNVLMTKINQIPLLDNIGYIRKSRDIFQRVYQDDSSPMATVFMYVPNSTWILDEESYSQGTILKTVSLSSSTHSSMQSWLTTLRQMIDELLNSTTLQLVYADLMNLSTKINLPQWKFDLLSETYVVMPEVNANALLQLHNLDILGEPGATGTLAQHEGIPFTPNNDVYPDANINGVVYNPLFQIGTATSTATNITITKEKVNYRSIVDTITPNPSIEDRIEALRFSAIFSPYQILSKSSNTYNLYAIMPALGDRYCAKIGIWRNYDSDPVIIDSNAFYLDTSAGESGILETARLGKIGYLSQINCAPMIYRRGDDVTVTSVFGDLSFFTSIDWAYLARINRLVYQGLFEFRV